VQVPLWNTLLVDLKWNMGVPVRETAFYPYPYLYPHPNHNPNPKPRPKTWPQPYPYP
jgi:hypothetical protein